MPRTPRHDALSQTQLLVIEAAARHPEHRLTRPEGVKPPTYRSALQSLRRRGLISDAPATVGSDRRPAGPVLSDAGLARIAPALVEERAVPQPEAPTVRSPRPDSKLARLVAMLARPDGASLDDLATAAAWRPHTTRAALTGLRKRGYALATLRAAGAPTRYRIATGDAVSVATQTAAIETVTEEATQ